LVLVVLVFVVGLVVVFFVVFVVGVAVLVVVVVVFVVFVVSSSSLSSETRSVRICQKRKNRLVHKTHLLMLVPRPGLVRVEECSRLFGNLCGSSRLNESSTSLVML
jgi:hypothetical protein